MAAIAADFAKAIRGELNQSLDVHHGLELQRLIAAVQRSIAAGTPVQTPRAGRSNRAQRSTLAAPIQPAESPMTGEK